MRKQFIKLLLSPAEFRRMTDAIKQGQKDARENGGELGVIRIETKETILTIEVDMTHVRTPLGV